MRADRLDRTRWCIVVLGLAALGLAWGCGGLVPPELAYDLHVGPVLPEGRGDYTIDLEDSAMVFSKEGLLIRLRHLQDAELNERFPPLYDGRHINPYTRSDLDPEKGYIPPRFTVFEVEVINLTYSKIEFDPAKATMESGGETYRYYDPGREGAVVLGGNSFTNTTRWSWALRATSARSTSSAWASSTRRSSTAIARSSAKTGKRACWSSIRYSWKTKSWY